MPSDPATMRAAAGSRLDPRALAACGTAALLAGLVYVNALHNPFVYDDYHTVVANASIQRGAGIRAAVLHDVTRPIVNLSYAMDRALWGSGPAGFHVTNVLLHMLNVVLLYHFVRRLAEGRRAGLVACAAAVLFAVHPMMTEAVGYISGRSEVLCATWFLAGLLCGRRWMTGGGIRWRILTVAFWIAALATKETAAMFPFVLFACDRLTTPPSGTPSTAPRASAPDRRTRLLTMHLPLMTIAAAAGVVRLAILRMEYPGQVSVHPRFVLLDLDVVRRYVWLLLHPAGQALFHQVADIRSLFDPRALAALGATGLMLALAWGLRRVEPLASVGVIWFLLVLAPAAVLNVLDQGEPMAEHRVYLAAAGFFLAAGAGVGRIGDWLRRAATPVRWAGRVAFALVVLSLGAQTVIRNAVWADPVALWHESVDLAPNHYRPRLLLGEALQDEGRREEAVEQYRMAVRLRPADVTGYLKLGVCLAEMGRFDEARQYFLEVIARDPHNRSARRMLALLQAMGPAK